MTGAPGRPRRPGPTTRVRVHRREGSAASVREDLLATEEPLEVRMSAGGATRVVAVTMRTPGSDFELAVGLLAGHGLVGGREEVRSIAYCADPAADPLALFNVVTVELDRPDLPGLGDLERHAFTSSACGVCGASGLEALAVRAPAVAAGPALDPELLQALPGRLLAAQRVFAATGGLHAAGVFTSAGDLLVAREDVGRHNAVDKVLGHALLAGRLPLPDHVLVLSGRAGFELVQKAVVAGIPVVVAVSAPSSLAVATARRFGVTLVGFVREGRMTVYAGEERIQPPAGPG